MSGVLAGLVVFALALTSPVTPSHADSPEVSAGAVITPAFAQTLYEGLVTAATSDGCRVVSFDTAQSSIAIGLSTPTGVRCGVALVIGAPRTDGAGPAGGMVIQPDGTAQRECAPMLASIARILAGMAPPAQARREPVVHPMLEKPTFPLLAVSFVLLVLGSLYVVVREARSSRPTGAAVMLLVAIWGVGLALRLFLSQRTFLHEYFHIAETITGDLSVQVSPIYGDTGPALFRTVAFILGRPWDVRVIFMTNAVLASLAIPAIALLDLALMRSWPRAICAAALLCVLPIHLRYSAAEDLTVQAVTFGLWALALVAVYLRTQRAEDALLSALALSLAMQTRPEMLGFPLAAVLLLLLVEPRAWRVLLGWRTMVAGLVLLALLTPRVWEIWHVVREPASGVPGLSRAGLVFGEIVREQAETTPPVYWAVLVIGAVGTAMRRPGLLVWVMIVSTGYTLLSRAVEGSSALYHLRMQLLPMSLTVLVAAGIATAWTQWWGRRARLGLVAGAATLAALALAIVLARAPFITALRDQQLEWAFLDRTVRELPARGTLLSAVEIGSRNLDAFPDLLLRREGKTYDMVDLNRVASGGAEWPPPAGDLLFYQGLFCYFAFDAAPDRMVDACQQVYSHYAVSPLLVQDLAPEPYSDLKYAGDGRRPFRIGFFRLSAPGDRSPES